MIEHFQPQAAGSWRYGVSETGDQVRLASGATIDIDSIFAGVFELDGD